MDQCEFLQQVGIDWFWRISLLSYLYPIPQQQYDGIKLFLSLSLYEHVTWLCSRRKYTFQMQSSFSSIRHGRLFSLSLLQIGSKANCFLLRALIGASVKLKKRILLARLYMGIENWLCSFFSSMLTRILSTCLLCMRWWRWSWPVATKHFIEVKCEWNPSLFYDAEWAKNHRVLIKTQETNGIIASSAKQFVTLTVGHVTIFQVTRALTH